MTARKRQKLDYVELLNVPSFNQGSFDSLCTYYATAMMLVTLFPEYEPKFGMLRGERISKHGSEDPILLNHGRREEHTSKVLAKWFYNGETIKNAVNTLNKITNTGRGAKKLFEYSDKSAHDKTFATTIVNSINKGLPVMIGWHTPDYSDHAALITGYWEGKEKWLLINDPGTGKDEISWDSLKKQKIRNSPFEIGLCIGCNHVGYRPLKRTTKGKDKRRTTTMERWTPEGYKPVEEDFV